MTTYRVECEGACREVFLVDADSPEEAMENWASGESMLLEVTSMDPVNAAPEVD